MNNVRLDKHLIIKTKPKANDKNIILWKNYRITLLESRLFRIELDKKKLFNDLASQRVWYRKTSSIPYEIKKENKQLIITTKECSLILNNDVFTSYVLFNDGRKVLISNDNNLKGTSRTLDQFDGDICIDKNRYHEKLELDNGVCSLNGVAYFDDSNSLLINDKGEIMQNKNKHLDIYVFAFGNDYKNAVKALYKITGYTPLLPRYSLGNWWSRYHEYSDKEYLKILHRFKKNNVPLTIATIDMDWHYSIHLDEQKNITKNNLNSPYYGGNDGWTGYSWNKDLFPDYRRFLNDIKKLNLNITLNLHPADGVRWWEDQYEDFAKAMNIDSSSKKHIKFDMTDNNFINNYFKILHKPYEEDGVSFWWIDWQQGTSSKIKNLDPLWSLNHYHYLDIKSNHHEPLILSRYSGIGSHRYPVGFSGDSVISWKTLKYISYFTLTASNVGYSWWSHDIGGHFHGFTDNELYLRFIQFGVFSPINRLHCCNSLSVTKEPWAYQNGTSYLAMEQLRFRHKLIPFLYSMNYLTHKEGKPLIEPLYYYHDTEDAYKIKNEYYFSSNLLVSIIDNKINDGFAKQKIFIPKGKWVDIFTNDIYVNNEDSVKYVYRNLNSIPVLAKEGTIIPLSNDEGNSIENPSNLELICYLGNNEFTLFEDNRHKEKDDEFFTTFKSIYSNDNNIHHQEIHISSIGEETVLPKMRIMRFTFKELKEGNIKILENGKLINYKESIDDYLSFEIEYKPNNLYVIIIESVIESKLDYILNRTISLFTSYEFDNKLKEDILQSILKSKSIKEYINKVNSSNINNYFKNRLKEVL